MDCSCLSSQRRFHPATVLSLLRCRQEAGASLRQGLIDRKEAVESEWPVVNGGGKSCRISSKAIYRLWN